MSGIVEQGNGDGCKKWFCCRHISLHGADYYGKTFLIYNLKHKIPHLVSLEMTQRYKKTTKRYFTVAGLGYCKKYVDKI
jgi:hypothetical protein